MYDHLPSTGDVPFIKGEHVFIWPLTLSGNIQRCRNKLHKDVDINTQELNGKCILKEADH